MLTLSVIVSALLTFACGRDDVIYPMTYGEQQLATRIHCQVEETQHFQYSSVAKLWGTMGGDINVRADVALHCLGDDRGGKYESEALKYLAEISKLEIEEKSENSQMSEELFSERQKRGVGEYFTKAWKKVKSFFSRMFGGNREPESSGAPPDEPVDKEKGGSAGDEWEEEDEFNPVDFKSMYSVPFQFVQLANGSIPEIRFSENEVEDSRIRNFKRHLVDAFATQLNFKHKQKDVVETTVTGEHTSLYNISISDESTPITLAGYSMPDEEEQVVTVKKLVTEGDIRKLAPSEALNDKDRMQLTLHQLQIFKGGKLHSSTGMSSIVLLPESDNTRRNRRKREDEDDLISSFQAHSSFEIRLKKRRRRSAQEKSRLQLHRETHNFLPVSRFAEKEASSERRSLRRLQQSTGDLNKIFENLIEHQGDDFDEKMQIIAEMIHREVDLQLDKEHRSASNVVRRILDRETLEKMCANNFTVCKDFIQLLAVAGGPEAEAVFLSLLRGESTLTKLQLRMIAGIMTDMTSQSATFLDSLVQLIAQKQLHEDVLGSVCLATGSLGSKAEPKVKNKISKTFTSLLEELKDHCKTDDILLDVLEAIGNLGCMKTVTSVLEVSQSCEQNTGIQIACAHALRHHSDLSSVKQWMQEKTRDSDCDVTKAITGALLDKVQEQQMTGDSLNWPRNGFNGVDENLKQMLAKSRCSVEDTILYFRKKKNSIANRIAQNYFGPEVEPWNPSSGSRQKRAFWDNLNCNEWTEDKQFRPIQGKEDFASDRAIYNKRKSCLAFRRLGIKGANAEIYAGMFAGVREPSDPPKYKLFTKFVSGLNFLGNEMEIGSFYFYHHSGNTKAYVRILGQTRQEFTHDGCTPTDLKYRPIKHIPLYMVSISNLQLSLGIHMSSRLGMDTECPEDGVYQMGPMTDVRIGGEALGTVAMAQGGINLGGNFNYKLQFTFTPTPNMCLKGSHGYDPMSISFETFYQLWNTVKQDWGKRRTWRPNFLSWDIKKGDLKQWFRDTCIRTDDHGPPSNMDRELE